MIIAENFQKSRNYRHWIKTREDVEFARHLLLGKIQTFTKME